MTNKNPKGGELVRAEVYWPEPRSSKEALWMLREHLESETYVNSIYQIAVYRNEFADDLIHMDELKGKCTWISINRRDKRPVNNWQDMQTIKNRLVGKKCDAIQMFPSEDRMVNNVNQYHLIVLPEDVWFPFGWKTRAVTEQSLHENTKQNYNGENNDT